jgi:glycosyltransferase involved in cell wall biosynthesis
MSVSVSILVPIKNEVANLPRCLASVRWADEVWVVDSQSTDGSAAIVEAEDLRRRQAEVLTNRGTEGQRVGGADLEPQNLGSSDPLAASSGVRLVQFAFNGTWPKKKNWALENLPFKHEWVFILDADEVLPPEAEGEIRAIVGESRPEGQRVGGTEGHGNRGSEGQRVRGSGTDSQNLGNSEPRNPEIAGYWINRRFMFMGKWLKHAYYPNWNLRLFKHRLGRYEKLTEGDTASGDNEVHEHVVLRIPEVPMGRGSEGQWVGGSDSDPQNLGASDPQAAVIQTGRLRCEMDHYAFPSIEVFVEKHNRYSNWEARVAMENRRGGGSEDRRVGGSEGRRVGTSPSDPLTFGSSEPRAATGIAATAAQLQLGRVAWRRRLKMLSHRLPFRPLLRFCYVYFWQRGFLDGVEGYYFARLHAVYELLCVAKTVELVKRRRES